ncbi:MAG: hypothetical protein C0483_11745 [Pirellula sp.]|nr:hypothetical protein [Pirellula sp.]
MESPIMLPRCFVSAARRARAVFCLGLCLASTAVFSQSTPPASVPVAPGSASVSDLSSEQIDAAREFVEQATDLDDATRASVVEIYRQCLAELKEADEWHAKAVELDSARLQAPQELQAWKDQARGVEMPIAPVPAGDDLESLKAGLAEANAALKAARDQQAELDGRSRHRAQRREQVRELDEAAAKRLEELYRQLGTLPSLDRADVVGKAQRTLLLARRKSIVNERAAYSQELPSYEATRELLRLQLDEAVRSVNRAEKQAAAWNEAVESAMQQLADAQAQDALRKLITTRGELIPLAQENQRIAGLRSGPDSPAARLKRVTAHVAEVKRMVVRVKAEFAHVRQVADLSNELGQVLVRERRELPDLEALEEGLREQQEEIAQAKLALFDLEDRRTQLADVDTEARLALLPLNANLTDEEREELEPAVRELLQTRRGYLDDLITDYNAYFNALVMEQDKTERELTQTVRLYRNYIDQRVLWVPSYAPQTGITAAAFTAASVQLISPKSWWTVLVRFTHDMSASPHVWASAGFVLIAFVWSVGRLRRQIAKYGDAAHGSLEAGMRPTFTVMLLTVLAASPAPTVLWFLAGRLTAQPGVDPFSRAFATTMLVVAPIWATIACVRQSLRRGGLAEKHFGLPTQISAPARRALWRLAAIGLPTAAVAAMFESLEPLEAQASLGRVCFCVAIFCVYRAAAIVAHPSRGLVVRLTGDDGDEFRLRLRRLWYIAASAPPVVLIGLSIAGYHYAAVQLACRLQETVWLLLGCMALRAILWRWLAVARKRLAVKQAAQSTQVSLDVTTDATIRLAQPGSADEKRALRQSQGHLKSIDIQTRRLLNSFGALALLLGTWWIWSDMLPALQFLDRLQLYSYTATAGEPTAGADGVTKTVEKTQIHWITAADVVWAVIILAMTVIAARNLPGLLEITCLQWLPMDQGARYAVAAAARYVIHIFGIVAVCNAVGLQWASIQWLAAAMTVGLGFGLQEIFANFISGLIILFERPIRVGDTVTIGDVSGTVNRIRGRATTIVDWDRKELIVPNKEFITGKLINWTLTDDILRTVIRVGISAAADFERAADLLLQVARANALVLIEPEPSVAFTQVGDNRLDFELRVFSAGLDALTPLRFQLNAAILKAFLEARIEIASGPKDFVIRMSDGAPTSVVELVESPVIVQKAA